MSIGRKIIVSNELIEFSLKHSPNALFAELDKNSVSMKQDHVKNVHIIGLEIAKKQIHENIDWSLLSICLLLHDLGRTVQYDLIGKYDDITIDHQVLASKPIFAYLEQICLENPNFQIGEDWKIVLDVCMYHGHRELWNLANKSSFPYLQIVADADAIENGCISAPTYLEKEKENDIKGFIKNDPDLDQRICQEILIEHMENGSLFDKYALCRTYADYFIFAGTLAVTSCDQYGSVAKNAMKVSGSLDEYKKIFRHHLLEEDSVRVQEILEKRCG